MLVPCYFPLSLVSFLDLFVSFLLHLLVFGLDLIQDSLLAELFASFALFSVSFIENLVKFFLFDVSLFSDTFLESADLVKVFSLFGMAFVLFVGLNGFVELLVLHALLAFFEGLDLLLLGQQSRLNFSHLLVRLQHLGEEVIWSANGHLGLNQDLHAFLDILTGQIVAKTMRIRKTLKLTMRFLS